MKERPQRLSIMILYRSGIAWCILLGIILACRISSPDVDPSPVPLEDRSQALPPAVVPSETPPLHQTKTAIPFRTPTATFTKVVPEIDPILDFLNLDADEDHLTWILGSPIELKVTEWRGFTPEGIGHNETYSELVLYMVFGLETTSEPAGCGAFFRAEEDFMFGGQHRFYSTRWNSSDGSWGFAVHDDGALTANLAPPTWDESINVQPAARNEYVLHVQNNLVSAYVNRVHLGDVRLLNEPQEGRVGVFAFQEHGETTCTLHEAWLVSLQGIPPD